MHYSIVTGIPLWENGGHLYIDDRWAEDIKGQVGLWESVEVFCPVRHVEISPRNAVTLPNGITFKAYADPKELLRQLVVRIRSGREEAAYEFAGTNHIGMLGFTLAALFGRGRVPLFITFDAPLLLISSRGGPVFKRVTRAIYVAALKLFRRWTLRSAHGILAVGEGILDEIDPARQFREKCLVIPLTLFGSQDLIQPRQGSKASKKLRVICADRWASEKGVYELLQAFGKVADRLSNAELHLFGDGPLRDQIYDYCQREPFVGRIIIHGTVPHDQLLMELRSADVLVNLTKVGDINRTLWEGAATGCALIASDLAGVRSFFKDGENALLVPPEDVDAIATALLRIGSDSALRERLATNAYELAKSNTNRQTKLRRCEWIKSVIERNSSLGTIRDRIRAMRI